MKGFIHHIMVMIVYLCHETECSVTNTFFRLNDALIINLCDALIIILCYVLILCVALIFCDALIINLFDALIIILCRVLILRDALISNFNSVKFICITTAASFLSRFDLITISLLSLHVKDFINTCMNNFNNDHGYTLNFVPQFFYPYYTYFYIFLYKTIQLP